MTMVLATACGSPVPEQPPAPEPTPQPTPTPSPTGPAPVEVGPRTLRVGLAWAHGDEPDARPALCVAVQGDEASATTLTDDVELTAVLDDPEGTIVLVVDDDGACAGGEAPTDVVLRSATVLHATELGAKAGSTIRVTAHAMTRTLYDQLATEFAPAKPTGVVFGFVRDEDGSPLGGATVSSRESLDGVGCPALDGGVVKVTSYLDGEDELLTGTEDRNAETDPTLGSWVVPSGPPQQVKASRPGCTFEARCSVVNPSNPEQAVFLTLTATEPCTP